MLNIAAIIIHNKTDAENIAQIDFLKPFIAKVTENHPSVTDPYGNVSPAYDTYYYIIKGLAIEHKVKFYQIIPYGVKIPTNLDDIDSYKVYYGAGDEDKTADHPRFFNWGLKRATDYGADVVVYLEDYTKFTASRAATNIAKLVNNVELVEATFGKIATLKLLKVVGQLKEDSPFASSLTDYKTRIIMKGLNYG